MRYLFGFLCACALVGTLPQSASAQDGETGTTADPSVEQPAPSSEPAPEEPALQLQLDEAGVEVVEMQRRIRNAKIGMGISGVSLLVGGVLLAITLDEGLFPDDPSAYDPSANTARDDRIGIAAVTLATGGVVSLLTTGILLGVRKRKLRSHKRKLRELQRDLPLGAGGARPASASTMVAPRTANAFEVQPQERRVQWDFAQSRLVF